MESMRSIHAHLNLRPGTSGAYDAIAEGSTSPGNWLRALFRSRSFVSNDISGCTLIFAPFEQLEADVKRARLAGPVAFAETKGTQEVRGKTAHVNWMKGNAEMLVAGGRIELPT